MVSTQAQKRLNKEYKTIQSNPPPYITAKPNDENILEWHYVIEGPPLTPYEGGQYHGMLRFPLDYPFKPPSISMVTPNGRFSCNTRLCLSMSDYHPDTWNPAWSVLTILTGLLSFMTGDENTTGSITTTTMVKQKLARDSRQWNLTENLRFVHNFPEIAEQNKTDIALAEAKSREQKAKEEHARKRDYVPLDTSALDPEDRARLIVNQEREQHAGFNMSYVFGAVFVVVAIFYFK